MKDQLLLNLISSTFSTTLFSPLLPERLQSLKTHLFNRSFSDAFPTTSSEDEQQQGLLETYVVRWVPTRVLCYARIFQKIEKFLPTSDLRILCIGAGCGSETLALQASLSTECTYHELCEVTIVTVDVIDSCSGWKSVLAKLTDAGNKSLAMANVTFHHADIVTEYAKFNDLYSNIRLVTLMFTLNELITAQGKVGATRFLVEMIKRLPSGSLILIVDSPTYSVIEVGGKKFPVSFLVDRLPGLEKVWEVESEWFRVEKGLDYPIQVENMRYFGRLMKKK